MSDTPPRGGVSALAIRRPVATIMVFVAITVLGAFAFDRLRVDLFPELDFPSISVVTTYAGVAPEEMETLVTRPLEEAVARVEGIDRLESYSSEGRSRVALRFDWGVPLEQALNDVRAAVERARPRLPEDVDAPVVYKFDLAAFPVVYLALGTEGMTESETRRFADDVVKPWLERVPGVAAVDIRGARDRQVRVEVDPERMASVGITVADVTRSLRDENLTVPAGAVEDGSENVLVRAMSEFESLDDIRDALVGVRGGVPVRIRDVATVDDTLEDPSNVVRINGEPGVTITVTKSPDANTIEVADAIYEAVDAFNRDNLGAGSLTVTVDSSVFIRRSIASVQQSVLVGAALALVVLLVFLRSLRSTLVIGVAIPISVLATFFLMERLDLTLNLITFGGLAVGIGMLVDNAIVILENIYRLRERGLSSRAAAVRGSSEVAGAIIASTLTTLAVFAPVVFLGGFAAVFFGQMALVVSAALACSLLVALTLVPVLSGRLLRGTGALPTTEHPLFAPLERLWGRVVAGSLRAPWVIILLAGVSLGAAWSQVDRVGTELLPESDESEVRISARYPVGTRIEVTEAAVRRIEDLVRAHVPEVKDIQATVGTPGFWSTSGEEFASLRVNLVPVEERDRTSAEVAAALRPILARELPGMMAFARPGGGLWIFNFLRGGDARVRVEIRGYDLDATDAIAREVAAIVGDTTGVTDADTSRRPGGRELQLHVDRERAADHGLTTREVAQSISTLVQGTRAGVYREGGDEYDLIVRLDEAELASPGRMLDAPMGLPGGGHVALRDLVTVGDGRTPQAIERLDQERIVVVSAGLDETRDLGSINDELRTRLRELPLPDGVRLRVAGEAEQQDDTFESMGLGIILALLLVYMVMAGQFESFVQPLVILVAVPFGGIGVVATLVVTDTTFNLNSFMGVVVLVGVVVNNAIVLVDAINGLRRDDGVSLDEAVVEASRRRLRPILMTTATTVLALLPVAVGAGTGGEAQAPLARVVVGGLVSSTVLSLLFVPVLYATVERFVARFDGAGHHESR
jgi:HAE1 family hydrophobic/amphiphilic exporter-1